MFFLNKKPQIGGLIAYYHLQDWWLSSFNDEERKHIEEIYKPFGYPADYSFTKGNTTSSQSPSMFLTVLSGWFNNPRDRHLAHRIIDKANQLSEKGNPKAKVASIDRHFALSEKIIIYYRDREKDPHMLDKAITACKEQIYIAPEVTKLFLKEYPGQPLPGHVGFEQLAIIYDKNNELQKAIDLCLEAKKQGWGGDWDKKIERYRNKINKK